MHSPTKWIRRGAFIALVVTALVLAARQAWAPTGAVNDGLLPAIGGDTWPPVPVKDAATT